MKSFLNILLIIAIVAVGLVGGTFMCHWLVMFFNMMGANMITIKDTLGLWIISVVLTYGILFLFALFFSWLSNRINFKRKASVTKHGREKNS